MELTGRGDAEARLARMLGRLSSAQQRSVMDALGDPPRLENIPPDFWEAEAAAWREKLQPELEAIYLEAAQAQMEASSIGVDWALVNTAAARWARAYTFELVQGITDGTRDALRAKVGAYFEAPTTIGELRDSLTPLFGPVRAEMIAVTEVTRAASNGELGMVNLLESESGIRMASLWATNNDDLVCPICGPKNGKVITDGVYPPAHPRCRCWVNHEFANV